MYRFACKEGSMLEIEGFPTHMFQASPNIFPAGVSNCFGFLIGCTHAGSHFNKGDPCNLFLAKSLFNALNVILSWLQKFATDHPDPAENRKSIHITPTK
jgi:hypothetical protein